jgi:hypothetical protein
VITLSENIRVKTETVKLSLFFASLAHGKLSCDMPCANIACKLKTAVIVKKPCVRLDSD